MSNANNRKTSARTRRIVWVSSLVLDRTLHKTSRIQILEHLAKRGHETYLIAMYSHKKTPPENSRIHLTSIPMRYIPVVSPIFYIITLIFFLPFFILRKKPDYVITEPEEQFFVLAASSILFPAKAFKRVLDIRSTPVTSSRNQGILGYLKAFNFKTCIHLSKQLFDGITIITSSMKKEVCTQFQIDPSEVGVWVDGVSKELFRREDHASERTRLRSNFAVSDKFVVLYHGVFDRNRGLSESVESVQFLKSKHPEVVLFMLGTGPFRQYLTELVKARQLQGSIIFHDPVHYEDVPKYIAMADLGLVPLPDLPYWKNQCPLNLIEYLSMKKPVLLTDIPANREIVGREDCGIYMTCDPASIAASINYAHSNRAKLEEWGQSGRRIIENKYNWEKASIALEEYLLGLEQKLNRGLRTLSTAK